MDIQTLNDSVLFEFVQTIKAGMFRQDTDWGFTMENTIDYDVTKSRWGHVIQVGKDVTLIKEGEYILIEGAKWTTAVEVNGKKIWRTKEDFVQAVTTDKPEALN